MPPMIEHVAMNDIRFGKICGMKKKTGQQNETKKKMER